MVYTATSARMRARVDCVGHSAARTASTHARTRSTSRRAQIIQLGRARVERGRRPPAMQNGGYVSSYHQPVGYGLRPASR